MIFNTNITLTVDVKLFIRRSFDTLKIIGPAKIRFRTASYGHDIIDFQRQKIAIIVVWKVSASILLSPNFALIGEYGDEIVKNDCLPFAILNLKKRLIL